MKLELKLEIIFIESFFFDKGNLVVLGNAFQKKTQQTPKQELEKALKIMEEYQDEFKK